MANTETIRILTQEVNILTSRLKSAGTGYLITAIDVINGRIDELKLEAAKEMSVSEQMQEELEPLPHSYDYEEEQARLRRIQDSAAGRKPNEVRDAYLHSSRVKPMEGEDLNDDVYDGYQEHTEAMEQARLRKIQDAAAGRDTVEHTKEYYDTERNRGAMSTSEAEGLGSRDPLPVNTFE